MYFTFFFKGASSSGVLTIQARTVYEPIKYYQTILNLYKSFGFQTLKANAVLNSDDAMTWYAPNKRNPKIIFKQRQSQALYIQQQKKQPLHNWRVNSFFSDHEPENLGQSPARHMCRPLHAKPHRLPCCYESTSKGPPLAKHFVWLGL